MKNILITVASATVGIFLFIIFPGIGGYLDSHYIKEDCKIIEIADDFIVAEDKYGDTWSWSTEKTDFKVGDLVDLKMYNKHTHYNIYDDEVVSVN